MAIPFWSGKNCKVIFFRDNKQVELDVMSWTVRAEGDAAADGVCGEDRDRLQFIITHFSIQLDVKQQKQEVLELMTEEIDALDSRQPVPKAVGFIIRPNDGTQKIYQAREVTMDGPEVGSPSRTDRNTGSLPLRCRYFDPVPG